MTDRELFERFSKLEEEIRTMKSVFQNDHDRLIKDGHISSHAQVDDMLRGFHLTLASFSEEFEPLVSDALNRLIAVSDLLKSQEDN